VQTPALRDEGISLAYLRAMLGAKKAQRLFGPVVQCENDTIFVGYRDLWLVSNRHIHATGDEGHRLASSTMPVGTFELLASTLHQAETVGEGLDRVARASQLINAAFDISVRRGGGKCSVTLHSQDLKEPACSLYFSLWAIVFHCLLRWLTKSDLRPDLVKLPSHASSRSIEALRLLQCPVAKGGRHFTLAYDVDDCAAPFLPVDIRPWEAETFLEYLRLVSNFQTRERPRQPMPIADRVRRELSSGFRRQADVCTRLNMSPAHLRRKLTLEGTCFRDIVDEHRRQYFERLSAASGSLEMIAESVGYSDARSLRRARNRWTESDGVGGAAHKS
jgi:AraC-like DNA-binding protein